MQKQQNRLKAGVAEIVPELMVDPDIQFYARRNPGYQQGNGLILICPGTLRNMLHFGLRKLRKLKAAPSPHKTHKMELGLKP